MAVRLANALLVPWQGGDLVVSDMKGYDRAAMALLDQKPLAVHTVERYLFHPLGSDTYHPPGYYYFLAGVYAVAGHSYLAVRIAQALVDTLTCWIVFGIGTAVAGPTVGLLAAAIAATYPPSIFYTGVLLTETLSTCLLAGAVLSLLSSKRASGVSRLRSLALSGILLGMAGLTRSVLLVTVPCALFWIVTNRWSGWRVAARDSIAVLVPIALVIAPVTLRNYQIHDRLIPVSTNGGVNFFLAHGGSERRKNEVRNIPAAYEGGQLIGVSSRTEPEEEAYFYQLGWDYVRSHSLRTMLDVPGRVRDMYWSADYWPASPGQAGILRGIDRYWWRILAILACLGLLFLQGDARRAAALLGCTAASGLVIPLFFWVQTRFRIPFVPCFVVLAAAAAHGLYRALPARPKPAGERPVT